MTADDQACGNVGELHHDLLLVGGQGGHDGAGGGAFGLAADAVLLGQRQLGQSLAQLQLAGRVGEVGPLIGCAQIHIHGQSGVGNERSIILNGNPISLINDSGVLPVNPV